MLWTKLFNSRPEALVSEKELIQLNKINKADIKPFREGGGNSEIFTILIKEPKI